MISYKKCEVCGGNCVPVVSLINIEASEWYCFKDHKSYPMDLETAKFFAANMNKQKV
jgi:hypothetical protein